MVMPEPFASHRGDRDLAARLLFEDGLDPGLASAHDPATIECLAAIGHLHSTVLEGDWRAVRLKRHIVAARQLGSFLPEAPEGPFPQERPRGYTARGGHNRSFVLYKEPPRLWWLLAKVVPGIVPDPWTVLEGALHNEEHGFR